MIILDLREILLNHRVLPVAMVNWIMIVCSIHCIIKHLDGDGLKRQHCICPIGPIIWPNQKFIEGMEYISFLLQFLRFTGDRNQIRSFRRVIAKKSQFFNFKIIAWIFKSRTEKRKSKNWKEKDRSNRVRNQKIASILRNHTTQH